MTPDNITSSRTVLDTITLALENAQNLAPCPLYLEALTEALAAGKQAREQTQGEEDGKPLPCPFCGHVGLDFKEGSTFRWIVAECGGCGTSLGETRTQTLGQGTRDEWMAGAQRDAIAEWNKRATHPATGTALTEQACKYGQQPFACTSSPMDCQCALDAALSEPDHIPDTGEIALRTQDLSRLEPFVHGLGKAILRELQAAQPATEPVLTTCNCRWDGETQVQTCELHQAHKDAVGEWIERAKTAEAVTEPPRKLVEQLMGALSDAWPLVMNSAKGNQHATNAAIKAGRDWLKGNP